MLKAGITVIIPTYNRRKLLRSTLLSLTFQTLDSSCFEVIVVDDGSTDGTEAIIEDFSGSINLKYFFQEDEGFRVAKARNVGIKNAAYDVCLFIDSGVVAEPRLLECHIEAHRSAAGTLAIVGYAYGFQEFAPTEIDRDTTFDSTQSLSNLFLDLHQDQKDCREITLSKLGLKIEELSIPWFLFWTCHTSCTTTALQLINGFDENFQSWGGEDIELAIRLYRNGTSFRSLEAARAIHLPHARDSEFNKESGKKNSEYIYKKHPAPDVKFLLDESADWKDAIIKHLDL